MAQEPDHKDAAEGERMRIDKFLKNSRLIKRRTVAKEACESGRILLNGKEAKPGADVTPGDMIHIEFGRSTMDVEVKELIESCKKDDAPNMYKIL